MYFFPFSPTHFVFAFAVVCGIGCGGMRPLQVNGTGKVAVDLSPSMRKAPVAPMFLPRQGAGQEACWIAVIDVDGVLANADATGLGSWGENPVSLFRERLDAVASNSRVRGVVLRINTPGGSVTASDIMWRDLTAFKRRTGLPVVACLMDVAAGGGYYTALGTDWITAHPTTVTGAIGCTLNLYNLEDMLAQFNIAGAAIKAGKNIDLGTPLKPLDEERRAILQDMADEFHERFRELVLKQRPAVDDLETTFDGRVFTARQAAELKLIDEVGYFDHAVARAKEMAGVQRAQVVFFHRPGDPAYSPYAITPNIPLQNTLIPASVPGLDRSRLPAFLYMWQIEPTAEMMGGK